MEDSAEYVSQSSDRTFEVVSCKEHSQSPFVKIGGQKRRRNSSSLSPRKTNTWLPFGSLQTHQHRVPPPKKNNAPVLRTPPPQKKETNAATLRRMVWSPCERMGPACVEDPLQGEAALLQRPFRAQLHLGTEHGPPFAFLCHG